MRRPFRTFSFLLAIVWVSFFGFLPKSAQSQQPFDPLTLQYATGMVKTLSTGSIVLTQAHNRSNPSAPPSDMTFLLSGDTAYPNRALVRKDATVMVGYLMQNGQPVAKLVTFLGAAGTNQTGVPPYGTPPQSQSPFGTGTPRDPGYLGGSYNPQITPTRPIAAPADEEPHLLPVDTAHDFNTVLREAISIAGQHPGAKLYNVSVNYQNDMLWQAEFDFATRPSGNSLGAQWADFRINIGPSREKVKQYEAVPSFTDQDDNPPATAPANLASPWDTVRNVAMPANIRQSPGGVRIELHQIGATNRVVAVTDFNMQQALRPVAASVPVGTWIWVMAVPAGPAGIVTADAQTGRLQCFLGSGPSTCPTGTPGQRGGATPQFGAGPGASSGAPQLRCNSQGKNCRPVNPNFQ